MPPTLALVKKENPKSDGEKQLAYIDRVQEQAYWRLREKEKRTKEEEKEFKELEAKRICQL